jgi:type VI secretion system protein VasD
LPDTTACGKTLVMGRGPDALPVLFLSAIALAAACRSSQPAPEAPSPLDLEIAAGARLNPNDQGQPLPTVVRIYQLRSTGKLERTEFDRLYRQPKEALGEDLLQGEEVTLSPGETMKRRVDRDRGARYVAVVALFRRPTGASWKAVAELGAPAQGATLKFIVDGYRIERR